LCDWGRASVGRNRKNRCSAKDTCGKDLLRERLFLHKKIMLTTKMIKQDEKINSRYHFRDAVAY
jgi:hypothetical protein